MHTDGHGVPVEYPPLPDAETLRRDVQTAYGALLHAEHEAEGREDVSAAAAFRFSAELLARVTGVAA